jgi:hypothetical protein
MPPFVFSFEIPHLFRLPVTYEDNTQLCPLQYHLTNNCCSIINFIAYEQKQWDLHSEGPILTLGPPILIN